MRLLKRDSQAGKSLCTDPSLSRGGYTADSNHKQSLACKKLAGHLEPLSQSDPTDVPAAAHVTGPLQIDALIGPVGPAEILHLRVMVRGALASQVVVLGLEGTE